MEIQQEIAAKKDEFEAGVLSALATMYDRVLAEQDAGDAAYDAARAEFDAEVARITAEMEDALAGAQAAFDAALGGSGLADAAAAATDALNAFIDERLAVWAEKYAQEEANAKWQEDSYYRYNLLRLLAGKQTAIDEAVAAAKADFAAALQAQRDAAAAGRGAARDAFAETVQATRQALIDRINEDDADLEAAIAERTASLDAALAEQQQLLQDAMEECRQTMKERLKEIYNYNSYDWEKSQSQDGSVAPYSHEQHQAFLRKFAFYAKDVLGQFDVFLANMRTATQAKINTHTEVAVDETEDLQLGIQDLRDDAEKSISRLASNLLEEYSETQDAELAMLRDSKAAAESAAYSAADGFKKDIIYSMHVIRYAGGADKGGLGFGHFGSSFYGKGNGLTGIDELDTYRVPDKFNAVLGFAQAQNSDDGLEDDDHHGDLVQMLIDAKDGFDAMIQACKDDFSALVALDKSESEGRRDALNQQLWDATGSALEAQSMLSVASQNQLAANNAGRKGALSDYMQAIADAFNGEVMAQMTKVDGWFQEKLDWIE